VRGQAVIAGIGHTAFGAHEGRSTVSLNVEAIRNALADARVEKDAVDALFLKYPTSNFEFTYGQKVAEAIGLQPRIGGVWDRRRQRRRHHVCGPRDRSRTVRDRGCVVRR
jgi:acetyl-CoA acetyltransferase